MTVGQQIEAFVLDVNRVVDRYRAEFQLPVAAVIGSLEVIKLALFKEHFIDTEKDDGEDDVAEAAGPE